MELQCPRVRARGRAELARLAHALEGSAASLGGTGLAERSRALEQAAKSEGIGTSALVDEVATELERFGRTLAVDWSRP